MHVTSEKKIYYLGGYDSFGLYEPQGKDQIFLSKGMSKDVFAFAFHHRKVVGSKPWHRAVAFTAANTPLLVSSDCLWTGKNQQTPLIFPKNLGQLDFDEFEWQFLINSQRMQSHEVFDILQGTGVFQKWDQRSLLGSARCRPEGKSKASHHSRCLLENDLPGGVSVQSSWSVRRGRYHMRASAYHWNSAQ